MRLSFLRMELAGTDPKNLRVFRDFRLLMGLRGRCGARAKGWEFACRVRSSAKYCNGDTLADLEKVAWCKSTAGQKIHEAGMKEPNSWGLYDMHGNVAEWTLDKVTKYSGYGR